MTKIARVKSETQHQASMLIARPVIAFAANEHQETLLKQRGVPGDRIWCKGDAWTTIAAPLAYDRGRRGTLLVISEGRVFGDSRSEVMDSSRRIELAGVRVIDLKHLEDCTNSQVIERALSAAAGSIRLRDRRTAKRRGRTGGKAKGLSMQNRREAEVPGWLISKIVNHQKLDWSIIMDLLRTVASKSTLRRRYAE